MKSGQLNKMYLIIERVKYKEAQKEVVNKNELNAYVV